jgi:hypothetical protein
MHAALFWFWNGNTFTDEVAFENLKEGKGIDALDIWERVVQSVNFIFVVFLLIYSTLEYFKFRFMSNFLLFRHLSVQFTQHLIGDGFQAFFRFFDCNFPIIFANF